MKNSLNPDFDLTEKFIFEIPPVWKADCFIELIVKDKHKIIDDTLATVRVPLVCLKCQENYSDPSELTFSLVLRQHQFGKGYFLICL